MIVCIIVLYQKYVHIHSSGCRVLSCTVHQERGWTSGAYILIKNVHGILEVLCDLANYVQHAEN